MTSKMESELPQIPTREQRAAVVTEVVQGVAKAAGDVLSREEALRGAWRDLEGSPVSRNIALAELVGALERAALLTALSTSAAGARREVTVASKNIRESTRVFLDARCCC